MCRSLFLMNRLIPLLDSDVHRLWIPCRSACVCPLYRFFEKAQAQSDPDDKLTLDACFEGKSMGLQERPDEEEEQTKIGAATPKVWQ